MFNKVLIANRGVIALRIIKTLKKLGIKSVAIYAEDDAYLPHVDEADEAFSLGVGSAAQTYLDQNKILEIIKLSSAQAVHPGYGFLSENSEFCQKLEELGIAFIGPTADQMQSFGLKHEARALALKNNINLLSGTPLLSSVDEALQTADEIGFPVILKSTAGGGGIGMQICKDTEALEKCWGSIKRLSENNFSNAGLFLEKYIERARHVEVQIFGDGKGGVVVLGDRDCSTQRRNQKVLEEAPAPNIPDSIRAQMHEQARLLVASVNYRSAGTVEFIYDEISENFYFLEVNTRLQVEHGVTELIYKVDIVEWMLKLASAEFDINAPECQELQPQGHAIQARLYAENPSRDFQPSVGTIQYLKLAEPRDGLRLDHCLVAGNEVTPLFDPMLAKIMVHAPNREKARKELLDVLLECEIEGFETNKNYLQEILSCDEFSKGAVFTRFLNSFEWFPKQLDVLSPGTMTTIQDYPGRVGYWEIGVPPSGPFDSLSFRLGNRLLGNDESCAGLEITLNGPTLKFYCPTSIVISGAEINAQLDGEPVPLYKVQNVQAGQVLKFGKVNAAGARSYCLFLGGLKCAEYLGSRSTFTLGQFGGLTGRALKTGDVLHLNPSAHSEEIIEHTISSDLQPKISNDWELRVIYGPHGAPDFFTEQDIKTFFDAHWKIHYNSSRTGIRLIGPKPDWARSDGGEAGMHPSNIHDNAYAIGAVDFTGDMPVILGPDGPSLGGFVCPVTVISADLWKLGQLKAGDKVRFKPVAVDEAVELYKKQNASIKNLESINFDLDKVEITSPIIKSFELRDGVPVVYRLQGDQNLLIEYGPLELDLKLRFKAHALWLYLDKAIASGDIEKDAIWDLTPGIRSLQIHYNPEKFNLQELLAYLETVEEALQEKPHAKVPSRTVHLPLSWDDKACKEAVEKYMQSVRKDAPWCPDNIEFIRRINGLDSVDDVKRIVFDASYVVMGLGDVYLGAPVATPVDPRHRLVTTKYNPARTWTAENSVGIGGSYLCIYGMEGPGGYQFVGRTSQMWNRFLKTKEFSQPWLLRFFDQIKFYEVSHEELQKIRKDLPRGRYELKIEEGEFDFEQYQQYLQDNKSEIEAFKQRRHEAFEQELQRWIESGQINFKAEDHEDQQAVLDELLDNQVFVESPVSGNVWSIAANVGESLKQGQDVCVLESMKMEIAVESPESGKLVKMLCEPGQSVKAGQAIAVIEL